MANDRARLADKTPPTSRTAQPTGGPGRAEHPALRLQQQIGNRQIARLLAQRAPEEEEPLQMQREPALQRTHTETETPPADASVAVTDAPASEPTPTPAPAQTDAESTSETTPEPEAESAAEPPAAPGKLALDFDPLAAAGASARKHLEDAGSDWAQAKDEYLNKHPASGKKIMERLVRFRKDYVDGKLLALKQKYPGLRTKSIGSTNLTSDYDVTLSGPGDVDAIEEFHNAFRADWGKESGTVFDTNLYAKDYMPVRSNVAYGDVTPGATPGMWKINPAMAATPADPKQARSWSAVPDKPGEYAPSGPRKLDLEGADSPLQQAKTPEGQQEIDASQDVAALVKQRKFMTQAEWNSFVAAMIEQVPPLQRGPIRARYDQANAAFLQFAKDMVGQFRIELKGRLETLPNEELLLKMDHENPNVALASRNKLYVSKIREVRALQAEYDALAASPGDSASRLEELAVEIKAATGEASLFAVEAYHSEGAELDVVGIQQGGDKSIVLSAGQYLQSFNEQFGDFLKDLAHYQVDGEAFYRGAKYLQRLVGAIEKMQQLKPFELAAPDQTLVSTLKALTASDSTLLNIRGGKKPYDTATEEQKNAAACTAMAGLGVANRADLKGLIIGLSQNVNALIRPLIATGQ